MHFIITFGCQQVLKWFKTSSTHAKKILINKNGTKQITIIHFIIKNLATKC